jgi:hypothetical protein
MRHSNQIGIFWQVKINAAKQVHGGKRKYRYAYTLYKQRLATGRLGNGGEIGAN